MRIPLSVLMHALARKAQYELKNINMSSQYEGIKLYDMLMLQEEVNPNCLYMIPPAFFVMNKDLWRVQRHENMTLICVKCECHATLEDFHPQDSVIIIDPQKTTSYMFNRISDIFDRFLKWNHSIHMALHHNASMQEILDLSKEFIYHPIVVLDRSFSVLAYVEHSDEETNPHLKDIIENGYVTSEKMVFLRKKGVFSISKHTKNPILFQTQRPDGTIVYCVQYTFMVNGSTAGYVISMSEEEPDQDACETAHLICSTLELYFERERYDHRGTPEVYETILKDILDTDDPKLENFADKLSYTNEFGAEGIFMVLRVDYEHNEELPYFFLSWYIRNSIPSLKPFIYNGNFYVLYVKRQIRDTMAEEDRNAFCKGFRGIPFTVSVSQNFFSLMDLKRAIWQSNEAFRYAVHNENEPDQIFCFKDCYLKSLLNQMEEHQISSYFASPCYEVLKKYDEEHNTDLSDVYMKYLENGRNVNQTANTIFLHRNTVLNKVKKAMSIIQENSGECQNSVAYILSYMKDH